MSTVIGFIFVIGILVFIHELGHFLFAKKAGIRVEKFSLGFGKRLFGFRRGETEYLVSLLPLGGYVKMFGEGGEGGFIIERVDEGSPSELAGFKCGDKIKHIEGLDISQYDSWSLLRKKLEEHSGRKYKITVEREDETLSAEVTPESFVGAQIYAEREYPRSFSKKSIADRLKVVIAGPSMNLIFPFIVMPIVFMIGISVPKYLEDIPKIGYIAPSSVAEKAGLLAGDTILKINGKEIRSWREVNVEIGMHPGDTIELSVERDGVTRTLRVQIPQTPAGVESIGIALPLDAKVGTVMPNSPAQTSGLKPGDRILSINGTPVENWYQMASLIQENPNREVTLKIVRGSDILTVSITPKPLQEEGKGAIGITPYREEVLKKYGFFESIKEGVKTAGRMIVEITALLFTFLFKLITGQISLGTAGKTIAGPIAIAQFSGAAAEGGIASLLQFTVFISINLGIINLLPIPILDGGHIVYLVIEAVRKKPLSLKTLEIAQRIGFAFLILIMFLAVYNDIARLNVFEKIAELFR
jgi:regulator of sigma E protease